MLLLLLFDILQFIGCSQSTEYKDRAVHAGKQYEYRVTAVGAGGVSDFSETSGSVKARPLKGVFF